MDQKKRRPWRGNRWILPMAAVLGAVGGYCYYRFVGCASGTCPITSNPHISTLYGGIIGFLLGTVIVPDKQESKEE